MGGNWLKMRKNTPKKSPVGKLFLLSLLLLFVVSCVTSKQDVLYLNDQIVALNKRVGSLEQSTDEKLSSDLEKRLQSIRDTQAELVADIDKMRQDLQAISGRVEEEGYLVKRAIERDTTEQDAAQARIEDLTQRLEGVESHVIQMNQYLGLDSTIRKRGTDQPTATGIPERRPDREPPKTKEIEASEEERLYEVSLVEYREGRYEDAISGFKRFIDLYPKSKLADNAQFWVGESYMAMNQYEQAILAFQQVIKKYPDGNKVPNAMLRQALAFYEIKDKISSRLLLKKIIKQYPKSTEAKIARKKLESMK
jgi:tol-pal system protein YbgF